MANDFDEVQFPTSISYGSVGGPEFNTEVVVKGSGQERRQQNWSQARERWNVAKGVQTEAQLDAARTFFYARAGRAIGFRFKNPDDYQSNQTEPGEILGTADGVEDEFQLVKLYTSGSRTYTRTIYKPVALTTRVFLDGVEQLSGWNVSTTTGLVTFTIPPGSGEVVSAIFDFDVPVRFDTDYFPITLENLGARGSDFPVIELKNPG